MSRRQVASSSAQPSMADNAISWLGGVFDQISSTFDSPIEPKHPRRSMSKRAAVGSPLPPGEHIASTPPLPSSARRVSTSSAFTKENAGIVPAVGKQRAFPAERVVHEVPPAPQQQQHHRHRHHHHHHEPSTPEEDLQEDADYRVARAKAAAKHLVNTQNVIIELKDTVNQIKRRKDIAVSQAGLLEAAASISSAKLELAQAEASAATVTIKGYSRPGQIIRSLMARWEESPRLDVDGAVVRVAEATRAHTSARAKVNMVWEDINRSEKELDATSTKLREAQEAHARASRVLIMLEKKADCAIKRAAATSRIEKSSLYWKGACKTCEMGKKMAPASSKIVATVEDGFVIYRVESEKKRARH